MNSINGSATSGGLDGLSFKRIEAGATGDSDNSNLYLRYLKFRDFHYSNRNLPTGVDHFDESSRHFVAVIGDKVVGSMRLIYGDNLPVTSAFPEVEAGPNDIEVSRLAIEMGRSSLHILRGLFEVGLHQSISDGRGPSAFGVVERSLEGTLCEMGIPVERVTDYRPFPEYNNTHNAGIRISLAGLVTSVKGWESWVYDGK